MAILTKAQAVQQIEEVSLLGAKAEGIDKDLLLKAQKGQEKLIGAVYAQRRAPALEQGQENTSKRRLG